MVHRSGEVSLQRESERKQFAHQPRALAAQSTILRKESESGVASGREEIPADYSNSRIQILRNRTGLPWN